MYTNPFAQGWNLSGGQTPSITGALPSLATPTSKGKLSLTFSPASGVLESMVYTAQGTACIEIVTTSGPTSTTYFRKADQTLLGEIKWSPQTSIVVTGVIDQPVAAHQWLPASSTNNLCRYMYARGRQFTWERQVNKTSFHLKDHAQSRIASTVLDRTRNTITLELMTEAISYGLTEVCIVAATLLYSNRI